MSITTAAASTDITAEEVEYWSSIRLDRTTQDGAEQIAAIAEGVAAMWEEAGHVQVPLKPGEGDVLPCTTLPGGTFDIEFPDAADFADPEALAAAEAAYWRTIAIAKRACFSCPLQAQCLANSVTLRSRPMKDGTFRVEMETFGVWGGYGSEAREQVYKKFLTL